MSDTKKVALVTGSASGIGLACVRALAKNGINMIMTGSRDETAAGATLEEIKRYNVQVDYIRADLRNKADIESLWSQVTRLYPDGIDILVNNAGVVPINPIESVPDEEWDTLIAVNLSAPFQLIKRSLPAMKNKGWGRIINVSSTSGIVGYNLNIGGYIASKHGICGLTKAVALETATSGVTCNAVCPAATDTPILRVPTAEQASHLSAEELSALQDQSVAELVEFLCLSKASSQMTGGSYLIDGGYTAQ